MVKQNGGAHDHPIGVMLVTGASRGIGAAVARAGGRAGYQVVVNYRGNAEAAKAVVADIEAARGEAFAIQADVSRFEDVVRLFHEIDTRFGALDVLVNNAGILTQCLVADITPDALEPVFAANIFGMFYCAREAMRRMSTERGGRGGAIVNMSSVAARLGGLGGGGAYAATKGAVDSFTVALAREAGHQGVRVNAVRPGLIATEIHELHGGLAQMNALAATAVPLGRSGSAEEVAQTVLWLATPAASYIHGAIIDVSGGR